MPRKNKIIIRTGTGAPTASDFVTGEPAFDSTAGSLYVKNAAGTMAQIAGSGGSLSDGSVTTVKLADGVVYDCGAYVALVPNAPTNLSVTPSTAQAVLAWTAPSNNGGASITDYSIQYSTDAGSSYLSYSHSASAAATFTLTGLPTGTYLFRVAGINSTGTGAYVTSGSASISASAGDPYWYQTALLLNGDTINDTSRYARTGTASASAVSSTAQKKFGTGSLYFSTTSDAIAFPTTGGGFNLDGDFVVEWWQYLTGTAANVIGSPVLLGYFNVFWSGSTLSVGSYISSTDNRRAVFTGLTPASNQWQHIAVSRTGLTNRLYIGGTLVGTQTQGGIHPIHPSTLQIGTQPFGNATIGYIDDLRITCMSNRGYTTSTITVPTASPATSQASGPFAVVLTPSTTSFTVPVGYTSMKAWAVGGGGSNSVIRPGGAGGCAYKTWSVTGGSSVTMSIGAGGPNSGGASTSGQGGNTTVTYGGVTITGQGGSQGITGGSAVGSYAGGSFSGGDGGATGGSGAGSYYNNGDNYGGAVDGNGAAAGAGQGDGSSVVGNSRRRVMTDVSGLQAALTLSGMSTTEVSAMAGAFGSGSAGNKYGHVNPGIGGGGCMDTTGGGAWGETGGSGAVVLYFS